MASSMVTIVHGDDVAYQIEALFRQEGRINTFSVDQSYLWGIVVRTESVKTESVAVCT